MDIFLYVHFILLYISLRRIILNRIDGHSNHKNERKKKEKKEDKKNRNKKKVEKPVKEKPVKKEPVKKSHPFLKLIGNIILILVITIIVLGVLFYQKMEENGGGIQGALCTIFGQSVENLDKLEPINVLVLGVSEDIGAELTDTIIVCNYDPQSQKLVMLSIPRDTFVGKSPEAAKGSDKINSVYSKKDPTKTLKAVNTITGLNIKYYAIVKNTSLINIVDILGGIDFEVPIDMDYDDPTQDLHIHLSKGMQRINGAKAEQLLRFRHNNDKTSYPSSYGDNDFGRMKTQRNFIKETIRQTLKLHNIPKARIIYNSIMENVETNIEKDMIFSYIPKAATFETENIISLQLPGESAKFNELWFFNYFKKETQKLIQENFSK